MTNNANFENTRGLLRSFSQFSVGEQDPKKIFRKNQWGSYCGGVPLAYDAESEKIAVDSSDTHTLIWGSTGSLKTRCVIEPTVKILCKAGENMIINDPKGEIFNRCADELKNSGYRIMCINIRDPQFGSAWNPLEIPYRFYLAGNMDLAVSFANDVSYNLAASDINPNADPFWENSASDLLHGLILLLLRYCRDHNLDGSYVNIANLIHLRQHIFSNPTPSQTLMWKYAAEDELISNALSGTIFAPSETRGSILSVFDRKLRTFFLRPSLLDMLSNNDVDMDAIDKEKCAVFLIIPDEKTTYNSLVSLFIKQSYEYLIHLAQCNPDLKLHNRVNFLLDEFSSLPPISSMPSMISAARSRDIRFVLAVQSQHQLTERYRDEAETIKSNCLNWIFLTSRELSLLKELSELCGEQRSHVPNISIFDLQHLDKNSCEALVLCGRNKPALVHLLDIDRFGDREYVIMDMEQPKRKPRPPKMNFELSPEIRRRIAPVTSKPKVQGPNPFLTPEERRKQNPFLNPAPASKPASAAIPTPASSKNPFQDFLDQTSQKCAHRNEMGESAKQSTGKK